MAIDGDTQNTKILTHPRTTLLHWSETLEKWQMPFSDELPEIPPAKSRTEAGPTKAEETQQARACRVAARICRMKGGKCPHQPQPRYGPKHAGTKEVKTKGTQRTRRGNSIWAHHLAQGAILGTRCPEQVYIARDLIPN